MRGSLTQGTRLGGKYTLLRPVGAGGMGEIWCARHGTTGAEVALKVLRGGEDQADAAARFRQEARLGATLAHRNIVKVFDFVEEADGTLALVMELLRGESLATYARAKGALEGDEAVALVLAVLGGLQHAHESGIVHRDVSPQNVFLAVEPDGQVTPKLLDFGIARTPDPGAIRTLEGRVLGTPQYMSPEQIRGDEALDGRSDLFSVGSMLVELLTGACPFAAESPAASLAAVLEVTVDPDPRIDPRLWWVVKRMVAKRPYERYATAAECASALREAVGREEAALASTLRRDKPPPRSSPSPILPPEDVGTMAAELPPRVPDARGRWWSRSRALVVGGASAALLAVFVAGVLFRAAIEPSVAGPAIPPAAPETPRVAPSSEALPLDVTTNLVAPPQAEPAPPPLASALSETKAKAKAPAHRATPGARPAVAAPPKAVATTPDF